MNPAGIHPQSGPALQQQPSGRQPISAAEYQECHALIDAIPSDTLRLKVVQQPQVGKCVSGCAGQRTSRWPIDPAPIVELISQEPNPNRWIYLNNPNLFCHAALVVVERPKPHPNKDKKENKEEDNFIGAFCSSLHRVKKSEDKRDHGYFVFGDLNIRDVGKYKIRFTLFEIRRSPDQMWAVRIDTVDTDVFPVFSTKTTINNDGEHSTLSRALTEAGVKLRLKKSSSSKKRPNTAMEWSARTQDNLHYRSNSILAPQMPPPPLPPFAPTHPPTNTNRHNGEDITGRSQILQNPYSVSAGGPILSLTPPSMGTGLQPQSQSSPYYQAGQRAPQNGGFGGMQNYSLQNTYSQMPNGLYSAGGGASQYVPQTSSSSMYHSWGSSHQDRSPGSMSHAPQLMPAQTPFLYSQQAFTGRTVQGQAATPLNHQMTFLGHSQVQTGESSQEQAVSLMSQPMAEPMPGPQDSQDQVCDKHTPNGQDGNPVRDDSGYLAHDASLDPEPDTPDYYSQTGDQRFGG